MNSKKGFTLIELLAVILILGVITLIAIPIVTNIITDAREQALLNNVNAIIDNVKLNRSKELINNNYQVFSISDGNLYDSFGEVIDTIADKALSGMGIVYDDESAEVALNNGEKCIMRAKSASINVLSDYDETCKLDYELPIMKSWWWNSSSDFHSSEYRTKITSLKFNIDNSVPSNAYESWDVSANQDGSVMAYIVETGEGTNKFNLYIGGKLGVQASNLLIFLDQFYVMEMVDFTNLDTSKVDDMSYMFRHCNLKSVDLSMLDTSNVTNMEHMFDICSQLKSVTFEGIDTSKVTNMSYMFSGCNRLEEVNFTGVNTSKLVNMNYMFNGASSLKSLDLSDFDTINVTNMDTMFQNTSSLTEVLVGSGWTTEKASTTDMFKNSGVSSVTLK